MHFYGFLYVKVSFMMKKCLDDVCYICMHYYMLMHDAVFYILPICGDEYVILDYR